MMLLNSRVREMPDVIRSRSTLVRFCPAFDPKRRSDDQEIDGVIIRRDSYMNQPLCTGMCKDLDESASAAGVCIHPITVSDR